MIKTSKGEEKVINLLRRGGIWFEREVSFKGLNGYKGAPLRFDFAVYNKAGQLSALIDVDGIQHFEYTPFFHKNRNGFKKAQGYDMMKNKYCLLNKIPFIRVPFWDLDDLTLIKLFNTPDYIVRSKYHNQEIYNKWKSGVRK